MGVCIIVKAYLQYKKLCCYLFHVDKAMPLYFVRILYSGKNKFRNYEKCTSTCSYYCWCALTTSSVFLPSPNIFFVGLVSDSVQKIPRWNFWKFLVNPEGKVVRFWRTDEPFDSIREEVTALVREIILKKRVELWWGSMVADCSRRLHARCLCFPCWDLDEGTVNCHSKCVLGQRAAVDTMTPSDRRLVPCLDSGGCVGRGEVSETIMWLIVPIMLNIVGKNHC